MDKLQYDSFYKFIVSIGTILIAAPIVGMNFLFTGNYDVMISEKEYSELSSVSLQLLQGREKLMSIIFAILPYMFFALIAIGFFCIIWGGFKWYKIQTTLDENIQLDVNEKRYNFQKLTAPEIAEKAINENAEIQDASGNYIVSKQNQRIIKNMQIENACFDYLNKKLAKRYYVQQNIRVGYNEYDIIAIAKIRSTDLLYEIKYWNTFNKESFLNALNQINKAAKNYETVAHRNFLSILLIVSKNENIMFTNSWTQNPENKINYTHE